MMRLSRSTIPGWAISIKFLALCLLLAALSLSTDVALGSAQAANASIGNGGEFALGENALTVATAMYPLTSVCGGCHA